MRAITLILESCKPGRTMNKQHRNTYRTREEEHPAASDDGLPGRGENVQTTASHAERPAADQVLVSYSELAEAGLLHLAVPRAPAARRGPARRTSRASRRSCGPAYFAQATNTGALLGCTSSSRT